MIYIKSGDRPPEPKSRYLHCRPSPIPQSGAIALWRNIMGKKTINEKNAIRLNLDIQMNLAADVAYRNPRMKALEEKYPNRFLDKILRPSDEPYYKEYDILFKKIYGEIFPTYPSPVLRIDEFEESPSELVLRIDLNYTKDEIMFIVDQFVASEVEKYKKNRTSKYKRKNPKKWMKYLEIWDLKDGEPPWIEAAGIKIPYGKKKKRGRPWTYKEIAKHLYPKEQTPEEMNKAIDRVKKQYRAAYRLICGKEYNPREIENQKAHIKAKNKEQEFPCDQCPDQHCKETGEACPRLLKYLESFEVKQQHKLVDNLERLDIERYQKTNKRLPTAEKQFNKMP